jgi:hypothetical protein
VSKGIINFCKVLIKFSLVINNTLPKVDIRGGGGGFISSLYINIIIVLLYIINKAI